MLDTAVEEEGRAQQERVEMFLHTGVQFVRAGRGVRGEPEMGNSLSLSACLANF